MFSIQQKQTFFVRMKRIVIIALLALRCALLPAQTITGTSSIGVHLIDSAKVEAHFLDFGRTIYDMAIDSQQEHMLLMFREQAWDTGEWDTKGDIGMLRLSDHQMLWTQPYEYKKQKLVPTCCGVLIDDGRKITLLDKNTGNTVWQAKMSLVKIDDSEGVVIGYKNNASSKLLGYDMRTGQQLWTAKVTHDKNWGWGDAVLDDANHLIVVCDNLVRLNMLTGETQVYKAKTAVTDVKSTLLQGLLDVTAAVGTVALSGGRYGYYPFYIGQNIVTSLHSNVVKDSTVYFFADRQQVVCLDSTLNTVWQTDLPDKTATHATLLQDDSLLYMFSYGYGVVAGGLKKMGRPFIAAFDKKTGKERFMNLLTLKKDIVADATLTPSGVYMMFDDGLAYQSDLRSPDTEIALWNQKQYGRLWAMRTAPFYVYYPLKGSFKLIEFDGQNCTVMTENGEVYMVNEHLDISQHFTNEHLYFPVHKQGDRVWVHHSYPNSDLWVVHELGFPEYHFTTPIGGICATSSRIYLQGDDRLYFLDKLP
jgi:outer membrane protein assembly factor BamB